MLINFNKYHEALTILFFALFLISYYVYAPVGNIFLIILLLLTVIHMVRHKIIFYKEDYLILMPIVLFSIFIVISLFYHESALREYDNYLRLLLLIPIYFFFRLTKLNINTFMKILYLATFASLLLLLISSVDTINDRYSGSSNLPITYGNMIMSLVIFTMIYISFSKKNKAYIVINYIILFSLLYLWSITGTRGSLIGLVISIGVVIIISRNSLLIKMSLVTIVMSIIVVSQQPLKDRLYSLYNSMSDSVIYDKDRSTIERIYMINKSIDIIKKNPGLGVGPDNYKNIISDSSESLDFKFTMVHAHNDFLDIAAKFGIISLLLFLFIFIGPIYVSYTSCLINNNIYPYIGLAHLISFFGFMLTQTIFAHHQSTVIFIIFLYVFMGQIVREKYNE